MTIPAEPLPEILNDSGKHAYIVCAYYTEDYLSEILKLKESLERFKLDYFIRHYESRGFWEANTRIKPEFLLDCLERFPGRDVVYLDADSMVRAPLELFAEFEGDIGVFHSPDESYYSHPFLTGTLYLKNNGRVRRFVRDWLGAQGKSMLGVDQDGFERAVALNQELKLSPLPASYIKIFDRGRQEAVIEHFQASRTRWKLARKLKHYRNRLLALFIIAGLVWAVFGAV